MLFPRRVAAASLSGQAVRLINFFSRMTPSSSVGGSGGNEGESGSALPETRAGGRGREEWVSEVSGSVSLKSWRVAATFLPVVDELGTAGVEVEAEDVDDDEMEPLLPSLVEAGELLAMFVESLDEEGEGLREGG